VATTPLDPEPGDATAAPPAGSPRPGVGPQPKGTSGTARNRKRAPLAVAAAVATVWAALVSYGSVLALTAIGAADSGTGFAGVAHLAVGGWLLGHGVALSTSGERLTLVPLAISVLAGWRLTRAGVHASRAIGGHRSRSVGPAFAAGAAAGASYGMIGAIVALVSRTDTMTFEPVRTFITLGLFGAVFAILGAVRHARAGRALGRRIPLVVRDAVRSGFVAVVLIVAAGAGIAGVALALHGGAAAEMLGSYRAGFLGQAGITLLCLAYLPNLAVWGAAYLLGPGFAVGADTLISPGQVLVGPVPAVPVLAGLPTGPLTGLGPALLGIPLAAGICAGLLLMRRRRTEWGNLLGAAVLAGPVAGVLLQAAGFVAAGALGSGRLASMGAVTWWVGLLATIVVGVGCVVAAIGIRAVTGPQRSPGM
jgi:hypothetical protein